MLSPYFVAEENPLSSHADSHMGVESKTERLLGLASVDNVTIAVVVFRSLQLKQDLSCGWES